MSIRKTIEQIYQHEVETKHFIPDAICSAPGKLVFLELKVSFSQMNTFGSDSDPPGSILNPGVSGKTAAKEICKQTTNK